MISCADAVKQLWEYLDGTVGVADRDAIQEHLSLCQRCCGEAEFAGEFRNFLASQHYEDLHPAIRQRLSTFMEGL